MERELEYKGWFDGRKAVIFDLDGTLYNERDYLYAAWLGIGKDLEKKYNISETRVYRFLENEFILHGHTVLFDKLIAAFELPPAYLPHALEILRNIEITNKIACYPEMIECLEWLISDGRQLFIVTNGNPVQQKNKIKNIEFGTLLNHIEVIYANEIAPKPDPAVFLLLQKKHNLLKPEVLMVGDSSTDESFSQAAGIDFIHVSKILTRP
jgi:HAD superfamily hydrolase (TIGR01549 family)